MRLAPIVVTLALSSLAAVACDGGKPGKTGGTGGSGGGETCGAPIAAEDYCEAYASAYCNWLDGCGATSLQTCIASSVALCNENEILAPIAAGKAHFDGHALACCLGSLETTGCLATESLYLDPSCSKWLVGTDPPGSPCEGKTCRDGACEITDACPGTCVAWAQRGDPCGAGCAPGLFCRGEICVAAAKVGESCRDGDVACAFDTACVDRGTRTCEPRPRLGDPCDDKSPYCDILSTCPLWEDGETRCVARSELGGPCRDTFNCAPELRCEDKACVARANAGDPCDRRNTFFACLPGMRCSPLTSTCVDRLPMLGEDCDTFRLPCAEGTCSEDGKCVPGLEAGAICTYDFECASMRCVGGGCAPICSLQ